jgi:hypothetical protein
MNATPYSPLKAPQVHCKSRKRHMTLLECVDSYVTANALPNRRSACFRCMAGQRNRTDFAES